MKKVNLDETIKVGKFFLDSEQFNIPKKMMIDFSAARASRYDENGKEQDDVQKYILNGVDVKVGQALVQANVNLSKYEGVVLEVLGRLDIVEGLIENKVVDVVKLINPRVKPLWVARGNNGSFNKVKLVVDAIEQDVQSSGA
ncbi:hypothetical protein [Lactococcus ileimucosae]|uniref:hypothetical protein n=1 Tax=Lactococcus ileimucosae TaxID=2941329 RepID=UPI002042D1D6|nr:hypothetical protein [Lactococcus ileimucosae]